MLIWGQRIIINLFMIINKYNKNLEIRAEIWAQLWIRLRITWGALQSQMPVLSPELANSNLQGSNEAVHCRLYKDTTAEEEAGEGSPVKISELSSKGNGVSLWKALNRQVIVWFTFQKDPSGCNNPGGRWWWLNLGSSIISVLRRTSIFCDIKELHVMGLGGWLKGKGDSEKGRSKWQPPRFPWHLVFRWRSHAQHGKCHGRSANIERAIGPHGL